jgi:photosystem II stability/assembly factor-like uncharacterized protein
LKTFLTLLILLFAITAKAQHIVPLQQGKPASIRGLSVVDDSVAWVSGSKGTVAVTRNGGKNWDWQQVKGFEKADFRDIEAFSDKEAVIMSSGTPALILKTTDGGASWQEKYRNTDTVYFFDAMAFADHQHGYILGDPVNGKFLVMETKDGGETWNMFANRPDAFAGEAAFAASGTCLRVSDGSISIVTGGATSRMLIMRPDANKWLYFDLQVKHGKPSQGAFSISSTALYTVVVGGDYQKDRLIDSVVLYWNFDANDTYRATHFATVPPAGYQSCVEHIGGNEKVIFGKTFLSTGTPGSNITTDGGKTWKKIDDTSYNVCRKAKRGNLVLLAGDRGKIGMLQL